MNTQLQLSENISNTAAILLRTAGKYPNSGIYYVGTDPKADAEFLPYQALLKEALRILGGLQARVRGSETKIVLVLERPKDFIAAFWACVVGGYTPCPLAPIRNDAERWARNLAHVDTLLHRPLFVSTARLLRELPISVWSADLESLRASVPGAYPQETSSVGIALLMLTSGSTGNSKAVELSHSNLLASMEGRAERQRLTSTDVMLNWVAFDHVAALLESHMVAVHVGATHINIEPAAILVDPLRFLRLIHKYRVSIAFAPNFLLAEINSAIQEGDNATTARALQVDLSSLRHIVTGGEANVVETGRRFLELLAQYGLSAHALWPAFGMTETCAACVYSDDFPAADVSREFAAVGNPIEGVTIRIATEEGDEAPDGAPGELQLRGPVVFSQYHNNPDATSAAFTSDGWFRSGDVGRLEEGRLVLTARCKDSIIVSGVNYFSQELETQLQRLKGVANSFVAAFPIRPAGADTERLAIAIATEEPECDEITTYDLLVTVRNTTVMLWGFRPTIIVTLPRDAFPKTSLGKIQRSLMRRRLETGEYEEQVSRIDRIVRRHCQQFIAPDGVLEEALAKVFSDVLGIDLSAVSATASFFDLGGTSLEILKLTRALDARFGLDATLPMVLQDQTLRRMAVRMSAIEEGGMREYEPIVALQTTGSKAPLFFVHPGNGEILVLVNLAKYFRSDRPFYALRARGFNKGERCFESMEEIVTTYVAAMRKRQERGPYFIAGYSLGCRIAFEIAKRLEAEGEEVAFLGCIDWSPCYEATGVTFSMAAALAVVLELITWEQYEDINRQLYPVPPPGVEPCEYVLQFASAERMAEIDVDPRRFADWARVAQGTEEVLFTHITRGRVKAMTLFCSGGVTLSARLTEEDRSKWRSELLRWREFSDEMRVVDVAGTHHTLMGPQHVASFQAALRAEIDIAAGGGG